MTMRMMKKPARKLRTKETMRMTMKMTMTKRPSCKLGSKLGRGNTAQASGAAEKKRPARILDT